jgi:hypothetical protein
MKNTNIHRGKLSVKKLETSSPRCRRGRPISDPSPCSLGLSATSQQYFSLTTNQPAVLFSQNKLAPAISHPPTEQVACPWRLARFDTGAPTRKGGKIFGAAARRSPLYKIPIAYAHFPVSKSPVPRHCNLRSTTASCRMGRKGRRARVSRDADADGSDDERGAAAAAAAPAATGSKSLYEVRRHPNPSWGPGQARGGRLRAGLGLVAVLVRRSNPVREV